MRKTFAQQTLWTTPVIYMCFSTHMQVNYKINETNRDANLTVQTQVCQPAPAESTYEQIRCSTRDKSKCHTTNLWQHKLKTHVETQLATNV